MNNKERLHLLKTKYIPLLADDFYQVSNLSEHIEDKKGVYLSFDLTIKDTNWLEEYTILYDKNSEVVLISDFNSISYYAFRLNLNIIHNLMKKTFSFANEKG